MEDAKTVDAIKQLIDRLAGELAVKKGELKLEKEDRDDYVDNAKGFSTLDSTYRKAKIERDLFKTKLETNDEDYKRLVDKVKDLSLEIRESERMISDYLVQYIRQTSDFEIPNIAGEKVAFKIKCGFSAKQLNLFAN